MTPEDEKKIDQLIYQTVLCSEGSLTPEQVREMSISDCIMICNAYNDRKVLERRMFVNDLYIIAQLIAANVWRDKDTKLPTPEEIWKDLFRDNRETDEEKQFKNNVEVKKAGFLAAIQNVQAKESDDNDGTEG